MNEERKLKDDLDVKMQSNSLETGSLHNKAAFNHERRLDNLSEIKYVDSKSGIGLDQLVRYR
jgi:hypothetical protein